MSSHPFADFLWVATKWKTTIFFGSYGGLIGFKNLPSIYEKKSVFEFGGLVSFYSQTLNCRHCSKVEIEVQNNICGLLSVEIVIKDPILAVSLFRVHVFF